MSNHKTMLAMAINPYAVIISRIIRHIEEAEYCPYQEELLKFIIKELKAIK